MTNNYAELVARLLRNPNQVKQSLGLVMMNAADAIEALETERDQLRAELKESRERCAEQTRKVAELAIIKAQTEDATEYVLAVENKRMRAELARVREALVAALEYDGGVSYEDDEDSVGYHVCCSGASYNPHRPYCWVPKARSALAAGKGEGEK